ncbi:unnamed protein product [Vitrella brassicaformis CCMP3155]|uniref:Uncharacterized protein n=1 Tax=Vitrella brassicaformis (strain CCMP3155) TaxID=1169540 RepID=A0A0G4EAB5_VITBC|nr:unnamed protein product [Vitrella brassicaformis CCMP3155]|eukprot:CEL92187.1 unnamed protein product [Vitrella brassicaformis CCMP3155]
MSDSVPDDLWRRRVLPCLLVCDVVALRESSMAGAALITAGVLLQRIDASLAHHELSGLIDVDRDPSRLPYLVRCCYVLEQGSSEWRVMGRFVRLGTIYGLATTNGFPLVLSGACLASEAAFHRLPAAMAIYKTFAHLLSYDGRSLALTANRRRRVSDRCSSGYVSCGAAA